MKPIFDKLKPMLIKTDNYGPREEVTPYQFLQAATFLKARSDRVVYFGVSICLITESHQTTIEVGPLIIVHNKNGIKYYTALPIIALIDHLKTIERIFFTWLADCEAEVVNEITNQYRDPNLTVAQPTTVGDVFKIRRVSKPTLQGYGRRLTLNKAAIRYSELTGLSVARTQELLDCNLTDVNERVQENDHNLITRLKTVDIKGMIVIFKPDTIRLEGDDWKYEMNTRRGSKRSPYGLYAYKHTELVENVLSKFVLLLDKLV